VAWIDVVSTNTLNMVNSRLVVAAMSTGRNLNLNTNFFSLKAFAPASGQLDLSSYLDGSSVRNLTVTISFNGIQSTDEIYYAFGRSRWPTIRNGASTLTSIAGSITVPLSGCSVDWANKRMLLTLMYAPYTASDAQITTGTLAISATVQITADAINVPVVVAGDNVPAVLSRVSSSAAAFDAAAVTMTATRTTTTNCYSNSATVFVRFRKFSHPSMFHSS
jgi:hypothetical protein